jgi:hypothetical protein
MTITKENESYPVAEVLPYIGSERMPDPENPEGKHIKRTHVFNFDEVKVGSVRLQCFKKSCTCVGCGVEGTVFLKQKNVENDPWHFNLFAEVDGELVLMTKDHIRAKSRGGSNGVANMQTMCTTCNFEKGAMTTEGWQSMRTRKMLQQGLESIRDFAKANPGKGYSCGKMAESLLEKVEAMV